LNTYSYKRIKKYVKTRIVGFYQDNKRYEHILGVVSLMKKYARYYNIPTYIAKLTGILHDVTKDEDINFHKQYMDKIDYDTYSNTPVLLHGFSAANFIKHRFNINDERIIYAIKYHTVGSIDHNNLSKLLFVCDLCEKNRTYDGVEVIRSYLFNNDLDRACLEGIKIKINYLIKRNEKPTEKQLESLQYFSKICNNI